MADQRPRSSLWKNFYHFNSTESTNLDAEEFIGRGISNGIVLADSQTGGRGRIDKKWFSPEGKNIYVTFFGKSPAVSSRPFPVAQAAALAVLRLVREYVPEESVRIKWPNDILVNMKKCSGILGKFISRPDAVFYLAGTGLNVETPDKSGFKYTWEPSSIEEAAGRKIDRWEVFLKLVKHFESFMLLSAEDVSSEFVSEISWMIGRSVSATKDGENFVTASIGGFSSDGSEIVLEEGENRTNLYTLSIEKILS